MKNIILLFSLLSVVNNNIVGYCDIKGNINNPGVYEINKNDTVKDIIDKAGGLKKNSYTDNINLSKSVTDEMVIYIHNNKEIEKQKELNNCDCSPIIKYVECDNKTIKETTTTLTTTTTTTTKQIETTIKATTELTTTKQIETTNKLDNKININTASLEELITIKGLGESKASKIIEYRNINGLFKDIKEILNVNGIGETTFEKIKEFIEI